MITIKSTTNLRNIAENIAHGATYEVARVMYYLINLWEEVMKCQHSITRNIPGYSVIINAVYPY